MKALPPKQNLISHYKAKILINSLPNSTLIVSCICHTSIFAFCQVTLPSPAVTSVHILMQQRLRFWLYSQEHLFRFLLSLSTFFLRVSVNIFIT